MKRDRLLIALLTVLAVVRVASTHRVFSAVVDEPMHLAAGYQWLAGPYTIDLTHPPLPRVLAALPLWLSDAPAPTSADALQKGNDLLYHGDRYEKTLARARFGNLLLFAVAVIATAAWARRAFTSGVAVLAVAIFTSLPPILAHAGLMTTDIAATASLVVALLALDRYVELPSRRRAVLLGVAIAFGVLSKFSFFVFFPPAALVVVLCAAAGTAARPAGEDASGPGTAAVTAAGPAASRRRSRARLRWRHVAVTLLVAFLLVWGGYEFDVGSPTGIARDALTVFDHIASDSVRPYARRFAEQTMPAPAFALGLGILAFHDQEGHDAYLLGQTSKKGWWYYFPVVFFYKTPIPFLLLVAWGIALIVRSRDRARLAFIAVPLVILLASMTASINIGVRHILPMYAPLSIVVAYATAEIWRRAAGAFSRAVLLALLAWLFVGTAAAHPDYLPWFNELAQPNPAYIAVDSNLDWGQDILRLERAVRELHIDTLHADLFTSTRLERHGIHTAPIDPWMKTSGWVAVSETAWAVRTNYGAYGWLRTYRPVRRIGESIRLYYVPR